MILYDPLYIHMIIQYILLNIYIYICDYICNIICTLYNDIYIYYMSVVYNIADYYYINMNIRSKQRNINMSPQQYVDVP